MRDLLSIENPKEPLKES